MIYLLHNRNLSHNIFKGILILNPLENVNKGVLSKILLPFWSLMTSLRFLSAAFFMIFTANFSSFSPFKASLTFPYVPSPSFFCNVYWFTVDLPYNARWICGPNIDYLNINTTDDDISVFHFVVSLKKLVRD